MKKVLNIFKKNISILILLLILNGCHSKIEPETVMTKGMQITAKSPKGTITILAADSYERIYKWEDCTIKVTHYPRKERWYGSKGIYFGGNCIECNDINVIFAEEGQQHFDNLTSATNWVKSKSRRDYVYSNDGIVVGWDITYERFDFAVWQILINGERPTILEGSCDTCITVDYLSESKTDSISSKIPQKFRWPTPGFLIYSFIFIIPLLIVLVFAITLSIHHKKITWHIAVLIICYFILSLMMVALVLGDYVTFVTVIPHILIVTGLFILMWKKK